MWEIWTALFIGAVNQGLENINFSFEQLITIFYRPTLAEVSLKANDKVSTNLLNELQKGDTLPFSREFGYRPKMVNC